MSGVTPGYCTLAYRSPCAASQDTRGDENIRVYMHRYRHAEACADCVGRGRGTGVGNGASTIGLEPAPRRFRLRALAQAQTTCPLFTGKVHRDSPMTGATPETRTPSKSRPAYPKHERMQSSYTHTPDEAARPGCSTASEPNRHDAAGPCETPPAAHGITDGH